MSISVLLLGRIDLSDWRRVQSKEAVFRDGFQLPAWKGRSQEEGKAPTPRSREKELERIGDDDDDNIAGRRKSAKMTTSKQAGNTSEDDADCEDDDG